MRSLKAMGGTLDGIDKIDDDNAQKQSSILTEPSRRRRTKAVQELGRGDGEGATGKSEDERDPDFGSLAAKRGPGKRRGRPPRHPGTSTASTGRGRAKRGAKRGRRRRGQGVLPEGPGRPKGKRSLARRKEEEAKRERMKVEEEVYERYVSVLIANVEEVCCIHGM